MGKLQARFWKTTGAATNSLGMLLEYMQGLGRNLSVLFGEWGVLAWKMLECNSHSSLNLIRFEDYLAFPKSTSSVNSIRYKMIRPVLRRTNTFT